MQKKPVSTNPFSERIKVDLMGDSNFFLSTSFNWISHTNRNLLVHLSQQYFLEHTAVRFGLKE